MHQTIVWHANILSCIKPCGHRNRKRCISSRTHILEIYTSVSNVLYWYTVTDLPSWMICDWIDVAWGRKLGGGTLVFTSTVGLDTIAPCMPTTQYNTSIELTVTAGSRHLTGGSSSSRDLSQQQCPYICALHHKSNKTPVNSTSHTRFSLTSQRKTQGATTTYKRLNFWLLHMLNILM